MNAITIGALAWAALAFVVSFVIISRNYVRKHRH